MEPDQKNIWEEFKNQDLVVRSAIIIAAIGILIFLTFLCTLYFNGYINETWNISIDNASKIGGFVGGFIGAIWTLVGILLLYKTLMLQKKELGNTKTLLENQIFESWFLTFLKDFTKNHKNLIKDFKNFKFDKEKGGLKKAHIKNDKYKENKEKQCETIFRALEEFFIAKNNVSKIYPKFISYFESFEFLISQINKLEENYKPIFTRILLSKLEDDERHMLCYYYYGLFDKIYKDKRENIIKESKFFDNLHMSDFYNYCNPINGDFDNFKIEFKVP